MSDPSHIRPRASLDELLEFANKVRVAGGGEILEKLMPGVAANGAACLIARNLNFHSAVLPQSDGSYWGMYVTDEKIRNKIVQELNLEIIPNRTVWSDQIDIFHKYGDDESMIEVYGIRLPDEIGKVAHAFDRCSLPNEYYIDHDSLLEELKKNGS